LVWFGSRQLKRAQSSNLRDVCVWLECQTTPSQPVRRTHSEPPSQEPRSPSLIVGNVARTGPTLRATLSDGSSIRPERPKSLCPRNPSPIFRPLRPYQHYMIACRPSVPPYSSCQWPSAARSPDLGARGKTAGRGNAMPAKARLRHLITAN
jgi:hypothetical protein